METGPAIAAFNSYPGKSRQISPWSIQKFISSMLQFSTRLSALSIHPPVSLVSMIYCIAFASTYASTEFLGMSMNKVGKSAAHLYLIKGHCGVYNIMDSAHHPIQTVDNGDYTMFVKCHLSGHDIGQSQVWISTKLGNGVLVHRFIRLNKFLVLCLKCGIDGLDCFCLAFQHNQVIIMSSKIFPLSSEIEWSFLSIL